MIWTRKQNKGGKNRNREGGEIKPSNEHVATIRCAASYRGTLERSGESVTVVELEHGDGGTAAGSPSTTAVSDFGSLDDRSGPLSSCDRAVVVAVVGIQLEHFDTRACIRRSVSSRPPRLSLLLFLHLVHHVPTLFVVFFFFSFCCSSSSLFYVCNHVEIISDIRFVSRLLLGFPFSLCVRTCARSL